MRKALLTTFLILIAVTGFGQYTQQDNASTKRQFRGMIEALQGFRLPVQGGHSIPAGDSLWFVRVNPGDGNVYMWDGLTWKCISCGSGSGADSSVFATNYRLDTTRSGLDALISVKLNDTAQAIRADFPDVSGYITQPTLDDTAQAIRSAIPDVSGLVPQSRTITINGSTQDLSANRSWTIPVPDTSSLRADIDANSDSISVHRTEIDGKEPIISAGTTADYWRGDKTWQPFPFIPDSTDYWTRNDADTSLQNIRDEIANLPAPPVTSVNGQTGNVVLQFMDTAYVSGDTIYAEKGGVQFVVGVMTGGGLDTAAVSAIVGDSLSGVIRQGGDTRGVADTIGTLDNQNVVVIRNGIVTVTLPSTGGAIIRGNSTTVNAALEVQNSAGNVALQVNNNGNIGMGAAPLGPAPVYIAYSSALNLVRLRNNGVAGRSEMGFLNTSGAGMGGVGYGNPSTSSMLANKVYLYSETNVPVSLVQNMVERIELTTSGEVKINPLAGTGTGVVLADDDGVLTIERPPASGTYTLKSIDGVIQWVED